MTVSVRLSDRSARVKPSITLAVTAKAAELRARGEDVISFGAGEPDFDTPDHIKAAAKEALDHGVSKYTHVSGRPDVREAVASWLNRPHGTALTADDVIVSCGAKHSLFGIFMALLNDGDEVIIPAPYWVSYPDMVRLAGGNPVIVSTRAEDGFALSADDFAAAITDRTRAVIINTPSNPTGAVWPRANLEAIAKIAIARDLLIITDDIYRELCYGGAEYTSIAKLSPDIAARTILVDGVSKTYAMTGWRIGFCAGPRPLIKAMAKIQGQSTSNPTHIAQIAARAAITGPQECVATMRSAFDERRQEMVKLLRAIPGVKCGEPKGAFYAFPDLSAFIGKSDAIKDDVALCEHLVAEAKVAIVPGSGFGAPGFARLSYASSLDNIREGLSRLAKTLQSIT